MCFPEAEAPKQQKKIKNKSHIPITAIHKILRKPCLIQAAQTGNNNISKINGSMSFALTNPDTSLPIQGVQPKLCRSSSISRFTENSELLVVEAENHKIKLPPKKKLTYNKDNQKFLLIVLILLK